MRESFLIYTSYKEQLSLLSQEQKGSLLDAMIEYAMTGEIAKMDPVTSMAFLFIKSQMDRDFKKYEETVEQRRIAGAKGGRPRKRRTEDDDPEGIPEKANGFSEKQKKQKVFEKSKGFSEKQTKAKESKQKQTKAKKHEYVYVYDDVYVDDYDNNTYSPAFEKTWEAYPRKKEKAAAYKAYMARLKDFSEAQLDEAVKKYAEECRILKTEERYIKHGATFFGATMPFADYLAEDYKPPNAKSKISQGNSFHNFDQRDYDFDALEKAITGG